MVFSSIGLAGCHQVEQTCGCRRIVVPPGPHRGARDFDGPHADVGVERIEKRRATDEEEHLALFGDLEVRREPAETVSGGFARRHQLGRFGQNLMMRAVRPLRRREFRAHPADELDELHPFGTALLAGAARQAFVEELAVQLVQSLEGLRNESAR